MCSVTYEIPIMSREVLLSSRFSLLILNRFKVNKCIFHQKATKYRHNVYSASKTSRLYFTIASITICAHPPEAINNISVGGQVGVFPQLLRLS